MQQSFLQLKMISEASSESEDEESLTTVMKDLKQNMETIVMTSKNISSQVKNVFIRAKKESIDWLNEPLNPKPFLKAWLNQQGVSSKQISIDEFIDICYKSAKTMDLESRILTFRRADAAILWNDKRRLTVFDIIGLIPTLFE